MFRGIIDEQRGKLWWWKREKEEIDKEPDIEARPLDFRHQLKSTTTTKGGPDDDMISISLSVYVVRRALVFPSLLTLWSRIRYTYHDPPRTRINSQ